MKRKKTALITLAVVLIGVAVISTILLRSTNNTTHQPGIDNISQAPTGTEPALTFDKSRYPLDKPDSLWVITNKKRPLPTGFVPQLTEVRGSQLQPEAANALESLLRDAANQQAFMRVISSYRSYVSQKNIYDSYVQKDGQAEADTYSARPGYSEHQTGLAADLGNDNGQCDLEVCFANTAGGTWLAAHAHTYGFIIRYTEGKTHVTGYQYEPWHIRYVGVDLANELHAKSQTMEEFFGLPAAPSY